MNIKTLKRASFAALVLPSVVVYLAVIIVPVAVSVGLGFTEWKGFGAPHFIGLANYARMFKDPIFIHSLRNNLLIIGVSVFGQIPLGFILAYILYRGLVRGESFFEAMIFLPITVSPIVVAVLWNMLLSPVGIGPWIVRAITGNPDFIFTVFEDRSLAIYPILFVLLWMFTGLYMIMFLANLQRIPRSVIEAAVIDGASEPRILQKIILPSMVGLIFTTTVFAISGSLKSFDLIFAMTGGGPARYTEVIAIYMYSNTFVYYNYGFGAAISVIIVLISVVLIAMSRGVFRVVENRYE
jgi:multiple sugar transport system permease protein/raffinose/stachyose/melibiose transport system permease protein